jgi:hypothetical protein
MATVNGATHSIQAKLGQLDGTRPHVRRLGPTRSAIRLEKLAGKGAHVAHGVF